MSKFELKKRQQRLQTVEEEIAALEARLASLTRQLENPPPDAGKVQQLGQEYLRIQQALEEQMEEWASLSEQLDVRE